MWGESLQISAGVTDARSAAGWSPGALAKEDNETGHQHPVLLSPGRCLSSLQELLQMCLALQPSLGKESVPVLGGICFSKVQAQS